jgi:hypothetical protein
MLGHTEYLFQHKNGTNSQVFGYTTELSIVNLEKFRGYTLGHLGFSKEGTNFLVILPKVKYMYRIAECKPIAYVKFKSS